MKLEIKRSSDIPETDTSYFLPWTLDKIYAIEPELKAIADRAIAQKRRRFYARIEAYTTAKEAAWRIVGWYARDPRLRSHEAWDHYFDHILDKLRI